MTTKKKPAPIPVKKGLTWQPINKTEQLLEVKEGIAVKPSGANESTKYWFMEVGEQGLSLYMSTYPNCSEPGCADEAVTFKYDCEMKAEEVLDYLDALEGLISRFRAKVNEVSA